MTSFFQDPAAVNWATWAGLLLTTVGFVVSIQQLIKIKTAARATERATKIAFALIRERISLAEVTAALSHVDAIVQSLEANDYSRAIETIRRLRPKLIELRQVSTDQRNMRAISRHLATLSSLSEELERAVLEGRAVRALFFPRELERLSDMLNDYASQMRYRQNRDPLEPA